jgi:hypothetical protein
MGAAQTPGAVASVAIAPLHLGVCWLLFQGLGVGYLGGAGAMAVSGFLQLCMLGGYVRCRGMARETLLCVGSWSELLDGWRHFVRLALAGVVSQPA